MTIDIDPALYAHLSTSDATTPYRHLGYAITPIAGGANGRVFRVSSAGLDVAVKFSSRDWRDRAGREHNALRWIETTHPGRAPRSLLIDRGTYAFALHVQSWVDGEVQTAAPTTPALWVAWAEHYAAIHSLRRTDAHAAARAIDYDCTITMRSATDALTRTIPAQLALFAPEGRSPEFDELFARANAKHWPTWPRPDDVLTHGDGNPRNVIVRPGGRIAMIDWEYSGWGDGAFDLALVITAPSDQPVSAADADMFIDAYCAAHGRAAEQRIRVYVALMRLWWVARFDRMLYEVPRGLDQRPASRPADWLATALRRRAVCVEWAKGLPSSAHILPTLCGRFRR
jgi:aminoglycoside phosphotransferase (APT) family kinase protein